jgi:hypothetical protein
MPGRNDYHSERRLVLDKFNYPKERSIMSNNTEEQITQNVLDSMAQAPSPRLKAVMTSLVNHLHDFIRENDRHRNPLLYEHRKLF